MPHPTLKGETLGQKHQHFNKLVENAVANQQTALTNLNCDDDDIDNLLKIDVACKTRNVDYILEVLKSEDMLYVSRALKRSAWLVTEPAHAHIVNPQYLHLQLFPHMTTKAINKLLLHIKLNLQDEKRVEEFYNYIKEHKSDEALRWLRNCSSGFVENVLKSETSIPMYYYKRLCTRSFDFVKYYHKVNRSNSVVLKEVAFLFSSHTEEFLDFLDTLESHYSIPDIDAKHTEIIMKKYPHRILNNFAKYAERVNLPIVAKYIKKDEIQDFILKHIKNSDLQYLLINYDNLKHFVKYLPKEERHEFVKKVFMKKIETPVCAADLMLCSSAAHFFPGGSTNSYRWYQYVPFDVAFGDLKKLIRAESAPGERCAMLGVLVNASRRNPQHLHTVLQYYRDKHGNEPFKFKIQFINNLLGQIAVHKLDENTWNILDQLFHSMEVYTDLEKNVQTCIKSIILYKVIKGHEIPVIIEKKFIFDTFKKIQSRLDQEQKDKLYAYLYNYISDKLNNEKINDESQLQKCIDLLEQALRFLKDWNKDLKDSPFLLEKIQQVISIKQDKNWTGKLSSLYNVNKKWRRVMFPVSLSLCTSEATCLNALKHAPHLLVIHRAELRAADIAPSRLLAKLRIYWPHTIAKEWTDEYLKDFNETNGHKGLINGLFILLPQKRAVDIAMKYVPEEMKINWGQIDQRELSIRKDIAKYLHVTRPQPALDVVLRYAKGDYLQYVVPSLNSVLHNLSKAHYQEHMPKFLDAPVSLQKYGISFAFNKLESEQLRPLFLNIWKATKNSTIRAILFACTHKMLCKVKDSANAKDIWLVLSSFIDNLSNEENKQIYCKLGQVSSIHLSVRPEFFVKSYKLLHSLPAKNNCESEINKLMNYAPKIMDQLDADFVAEYLLKSIDEKFCTVKSVKFDVISTYVLQGRSAEEQMKRFDRVLLPTLERAIQSWDTVIDNEYLVKNNFRDFSYSLTYHFKGLLTTKQIHVPIELVAAIKDKFDEKMLTNEKYLILTYWKLAESYVKLVDEHKSLLDTDKDMSTWDYQNYETSGEIEKMWDKLHVEILPVFGSICLQNLQEDLNKYFPSIYTLFSVALNGVFQQILSQKATAQMDTLRHMLVSEDCIQSYILACEMIPKYVHSDEEISKRAEIRQILASHPSEEVQMHVLKAFQDIPNVTKKEENIGGEVKSDKEEEIDKDE